MTLTSTNTFSITDSGTETEEATVTVLPIAGPGEGAGRLVHPTLGTLDFSFRPDSWRNFRSDVTVRPVWQIAQTLAGSVYTLWSGSVEDVVVEESWTDAIAMPADEFDLLNAMFQAPPDPNLGTPDGFVQWFPRYASDLGFYVVLLDVQCGDSEQTFNDVSDIEDADGNSWIGGPVVLTLGIRGRIE